MNEDTQPDPELVAMKFQAHRLTYGSSCYLPNFQTDERLGIFQILNVRLKCVEEEECILCLQF